MSSIRTKKLQQECVRLSSLQMKSTGERYLELDRQWSRVAVLLNKSRLRDFINATNKACSGLAGTARLESVVSQPANR